MCGTYAHNGKSACTCHGIGENALIDLVLGNIRNLAKVVQYDEERIINVVLDAQKVESTSYHAAYQSELEANYRQIEKLDILIENLYEDKVSGTIPESLFKRQIQKYEKKRTEYLQSINTLEKRIKTIKPITESTITWANLIKKYTEIDRLDKETLLILIDKIIVSEAKFINGKRICDIQIIYNYLGNVEELELTKAVKDCELQNI